MRSSDFCACYDGDMGHSYPDGVLAFLEKYHRGLQGGAV